ncbi:hypothetical protein, partial [Escherichia coli]|uniref:hypothetical protein n=1 Tax=Escherichia coli TaxID=562 RepID=UPI000BCF604C
TFRSCTGIIVESQRLRPHVFDLAIVCRFLDAPFLAMVEPEHGGCAGRSLAVKTFRSCTGIIVESQRLRPHVFDLAIVCRFLDAP